MGSHCIYCGKEVGKGILSCPSCQEKQARRGRKKWMIYGLVTFCLFLTLLFYLFREEGMVSFYLHPDYIFDRPVALVNGEKIMSREFYCRLQEIRSLLNDQYGEWFFKERKDLIRSLLLEKMVEECLLRQEARRHQMTVTNEEVNRELQQFKHLVSAEAQTLDEDSVREHVCQFLLFRKLFENEGFTPEGYLSWIQKKKKESHIELLRDKGRLNLCPDEEGNSGCCY